MTIMFCAAIRKYASFLLGSESMKRCGLSQLEQICYRKLLLEQEFNMGSNWEAEEAENTTILGALKKKRASWSLGLGGI